MTKLTEPLTKPVAPEEWECCNSECNDACVWQIYYREKAEYKRQKALLKSAAATDVDVNMNGARHGNGHND